MADQTVAAAINATLSHLYTHTRPERDKLGGSYTAAGTTLTTTYQRPAIKAGARLSIDLEDFHVWSVSGATVTVKGADNGSTAANHSNGADILVNAEYTPFEVFRAINDELNSLSGPGALWKVSTVTLTYNAAHMGYDLTGVTNVDGILSVVAETSGSDRARLPVPWRLERNVDTAVFPSGIAVMLGGGWPGQDVVVAFKNQFSPVTALTDNVSAVSGLPQTALDLLAMGAALRLAAPAEIDRNQMSSQGGSRRANEVPAGSRVNAVRGLAALYQRRLGQEADRLARAYPTRLVRR